MFVKKKKKNHSPHLRGGALKRWDSQSSVPTFSHNLFLFVAHGTAGLPFIRAPPLSLRGPEIASGLISLVMRGNETERLDARAFLSVIVSINAVFCSADL